MPQTPHIEKHFSSSETVRDIVIGMSDGLTVPFAIAAGLSGAISSTHIIITAGFAEITAGAIAMGLGGYLAAKGDIEHYNAEETREYNEVLEVPLIEEEEVAKIFKNYGLTQAQINPITEAFKKQPSAWVDFMMRFELGLEKTNPKRTFKSARNIALSYIIGGLVPLSPYLFTKNVQTALLFSVAATLIALFIFGYIKGHFTGTRPWRSAGFTILVGGLAAGAAFAIAKLVNQ